MPSNTSYAINNLEYDLVTVLHNKSEALKAYDMYIQDAKEKDSQPCVQLFQKLMQQEQEQIQEVRQHLKEVMEKGKM